MALYSCVRCVACLLKALKIMHCIKKMLTVVIWLAIAAMGITVLTENKKAVRNAVRMMKKKVF